MNKRELCSMVLCFILGILLSVLAIFSLEYYKLDELRTQTKYVTDSQLSRLKYVISTLLLKTQTLEMLVMEGEGKVSEFDRIARALCDSDAIRSLQLAPDGVVTQIYPLEGNEEGFGDLFSDPDRATEAIAARDSGELTLSGPFSLYQGGLGMIARRPIYLDKDGGKKDFWGFAVIVLDLPEALYPAQLDTFTKAGFLYKLYRINPDTNQVQIIDEASPEALESPVETSFEVPNGTWYFSVMPAGGWIDRKALAVETLVAVILSGLIAVIIGTVLSLKRQQREYYTLSMTDNLTGLYNYSRFMKRLKDNYHFRRETLLFFMDLDGFKAVNDTFGHNAGNQVLVEAARRLLECFDDEGEVFRNGGDEFCAVISGKNGKPAGPMLLEKVKKAFTVPFVLEAGEVRCGISIGFALYPADSANMEELIKRADGRMYEMKEQLKRGLFEARD